MWVVEGFVSPSEESVEGISEKHNIFFVGGGLVRVSEEGAVGAPSSVRSSAFL